MTYSRDGIYNYVYDAIIAAYPTAYIASVFEPVPASYPAVLIREIGRYTEQKAITLSGEQGVKRLTFEVQVSSNKETAPAAEAFAIDDVITEAFARLNFVEDNRAILEDGENGMYRLKSTFRRVVGAADDMPTASTVSAVTQGE